MKTTTQTTEGRTMKDAEISKRAREQFAASKAAGNDSGVALDSVHELVAALATTDGRFDDATLTWTSDMADEDDEEVQS